MLCGLGVARARKNKLGSDHDYAVLLVLTAAVVVHVRMVTEIGCV